MVGRVDGADSLFTKIEKLVKDANASSVATLKMGKKVLAYPIKKQTDGEYFLFNFEAPGEAILQISEGLRIEQEAVLRYMLLKMKETKPGVVKVESERSKTVKKVSVDSDLIGPDIIGIGVETKDGKEENVKKVTTKIKAAKAKKK